MVNAYKVLGLHNFATRKEIRLAYRSMSKQYHPDLHRGDEFYEEKFKEVQAAYAVLSDFGQRMELDTFLRRQSEMAVDDIPADVSPEPEDEYTGQATSSQPEEETSEGEASVRSRSARKRRLNIVLNVAVVFCIAVAAIYCMDRIKKETPGYVADYYDGGAKSETGSALFDGSEEPQMKDDNSYETKSGGKSFSIHSTKEEVIDVQGEPTDIVKVSALKQEIWYYGMSSVTFDNNRVSEYANIAENLQVSYFATTPKKAGRTSFSIGAAKNDVLIAQGNPTTTMRIKPLNQEIWYYGESSITFEKGRVNEYMNDGQNLNVIYSGSLEASIGNRSFTIGSTKDDVLRAQGNPTSTSKLDALNKEIWRYGISQIIFKSERVSEFSNNGKNLKIQ